MTPTPTSMSCIRRGVRDLTPYSGSPPDPRIDLWLDTNEGVWPQADPAPLPDPTRYPDARALEADLAAYHAVVPEQVIVTAGGDEAIDRIMRAVIEPGDEIVLTRPTFEMIERYATLAGAAVNAVPWWQGDYPLTQVLALCTPRTRLLAVVSPNNPTGSTISYAACEDLIRRAGDRWVLLDLAYAEFDEQDLMPLVRAHCNVIAVRTFSKAFGMAGARVGYSIANPILIRALRSVAGPYPVASPSLELARERLAQASRVLPAVVRRVVSERECLVRLCRELGVTALDSHANFVLIKPPDPASLRSSLASRGISIRTFRNKGELDSFVRITLPQDDRAMNRLQSALRNALSQEPQS